MSGRECVFQDKSATELFKSITRAVTPKTSAGYSHYIDGPSVKDEDLVTDGVYQTTQLRLQTQVMVNAPDGYTHALIDPQDWLVDWVWETLGFIPDWYFFKVVVRGDGSLLFIVSYNKILGTRWLRVFTPEELPAEWLAALIEKEDDSE